jgi:hypothetical protein
MGMTTIKVVSPEHAIADLSAVLGFDVSAGTGGAGTAARSATVPGTG